MASGLSKTSTISLIEAFKDEPCLWDFNHKNYSKKEKRTAAFRRIKEKMKEDNLSGR